MAKISFLFFVVALIAFLNVYEARLVVKIDAFAKDLHKAEAMIEKDIKAKKTSIHNLSSEVKTLNKSEHLLKELEDAHKKKMGPAPIEKKLKNFSRVETVKKAPEKKPVSIIQSILKDFGLNGGK